MTSASVHRSVSPAALNMMAPEKRQPTPAYMSPHSSPALSFGSPAMSQGSSWATLQSPRHSPALSFGSPAMSQGSSWATLQSPRLSPMPSRRYHSNSPSPSEHSHLRPANPLPSPPQLDNHYSPTGPDYSRNAIQGTPLSPPCSTDGVMSPHSAAHDYGKDMAMDPSLPSMWMHEYRDSSMPLSMPGGHADPQSPIITIEDVLREEDPHHAAMGSLGGGGGGGGGGYLDENGFAEPHANRGPSGRRRAPFDILAASYEPRSDAFAPLPVGYGSLSQDVMAAAKQREQPRRKRHLTDPSEANYHCAKCGKYFSRIWNYNAHLETHDPTRPRPHICTAPGCNKAFVRRTDLARHHQCVHNKDKKFRCSMCHNMFARKDTLRRHEDDGCPKRLNIVSRSSKNKPMPLWSSSALNLMTAPRPDQEHEALPDQYGFAHFDTPSMRPYGQEPTLLPPLTEVVQRAPGRIW